MAETFKERLQKRIKAKSFIGREAELALFKSLLEQDEPDYLILLVHGIGGVGKTWLLNQWEGLAREKEFPIARVNEDQSSVEQILKTFRDDFVKQGFDFKEFDDSYQKFRQLKSEAEKALSQWAEQHEEGVAQTAGRLTGKSIAVIAKLFTPSREALELLGGSEKVEQAFAEGFGYLRKWFTRKEDLAFLENPLVHLTRSFVQDVNHLCQNTRAVLFFDTYEYLAPFSDEWLCRTFLHEELSDQIMFIFAGRDTFSPLWLEFQPLARQIPLAVFTDEEARTYLSSRGVTDPQIIEEILKVSGKLPVYLAMLTTQADDSFQDSGTLTESVVERFLKWIPQRDLSKRRAVIYLVFPRFFNKEIVQAMIGIDDISTDFGKDLFDWLRGLPFISRSKNGWAYHELVREQILRYKYKDSVQEWKELHERALAYYRQKPGEETLVEELYHTLCVDIKKGVQFGLTELFRRGIYGESIKDWMVKTEDILHQVEKERDLENLWFRLWRERLEQIVKKASDPESMLKLLGEDESLPTSARIGGYVTLGNMLYNHQRYEEAERAYHKAIELNPDNVIAYNNLGLLFYNLHRYDEAERAYHQAINFDPDYADVYNNLGLLFAAIHRYEEAEQAYKKAINLKTDYATAYNNWGNLLVILHRYKEAEQAYKEAIVIDPDFATAYSNLAILLSVLQRYEKAGKMYYKAITLKPDDATIYHSLGFLLSNLHLCDEVERTYPKVIEFKSDYVTHTNPYIVGAPLKDKTIFFGRDDIFEKIRSHLIGKHQDNVIVIYGQRRTGKTSILYQMEQRLNEHEERYVAVLIDVQGLALKGIDNFLWELACTIQRSLSPKYSIERPERTFFQTDPRNTFRESFLPVVKKTIDNRRLLFMFDEADRFEEAMTNRQLEADFPDYLRNLMQHQEDVSFIFVRGSKFGHMKQDHALMFNVTSSIPVSFLDHDSARALVTLPITELYTLEDAAIERLLDITSGHPFYTQLLCQQLFILWEKKQWEQVTKADVESILEEAVDRAVVNFEYTWNESDPHQKLTLATLAEIKRDNCTPAMLEYYLQEKQIPVKQIHITHALEELSKRELIRSPANPCFTVDLLRLWLAREKPLSWVYSELQDKLR